MTATYTFDIFSTLDGFGSYDVTTGDWGGYWGKEGPEFLQHRFDQYGTDQRMVFGANSFREFVDMMGGVEEGPESWATRMRRMPTTVVSSTIEGPVDWPDATIRSASGVDIVAALKAESDVPLRSHGSLTLNHALMAAGLVDRIQVTLFPVVSGRTGIEPIFAGADDFDLELLEARTFDGNIQELTYRPTLHGSR